MIRRLAFALAAALIASPAIAHQVGCDGKPVPDNIRASCCGKADARQIDPSNVHQDAVGTWHILVGTTELLVADAKAEPSPDQCYWLFWPSSVSAEQMNANVSIYCFFVPMDL